MQFPNARLFFLGLGTVLLVGLLSPSAHACRQPSEFPPNAPDYMRRDNNRCEGIRRIDSSNRIELISFTTTTLRDTNYPNTLTLRVPGTANSRNRPTIVMQSFSSYYRLDQVAAQATVAGYQFLLNTRILSDRSIQPGTLRATAAIRSGGSTVFYPVVLGQASGAYDIVVSIPTGLETLEIRQNGQRIAGGGARELQSGHYAISWTYRGAPAGRYQVYLRDRRGQSRTFNIQHNPAWF